MDKWRREIAAGAAGGLLVLALILGVDLSIFLLPFGILLLLGMLLKRQNPWQTGFSLSPLGSAGENPLGVVTFADIGGQEVAKREFLEALVFLKESDKLSELGIRPLKGVLLVGPPGTGKTLMAKAAANYTDSVFLAVSGSEFVQMYAGVGASRVRQLFKQARSAAEQKGKGSAIIFIDEIDVLGAKRGQNHSHLEYDQTLNELLAQIDGVQSGPPVRILVVGATNRSDLLDPALLRPGRFDRLVQVDLPDKKGREHILRIHSKNKPLASDVDLRQVAAETFGFSGAHLESLLNEAAINALRGDRQKITREDLQEAIEKIMLGERSNRTPKRAELERIALHEAGHALVGEKVAPGSIASITITPRNNVLGYIRRRPQGDQYLYTEDELSQAIQICVAGAVSEALVLGQRSTGAAGDIEQAAELAKKMVFAGLSPLGTVGPELPGERLHQAVTEIIESQEKKVESYLSCQVPLLKTIAQRLLAQETLSGDELRHFLFEQTG